MLPRRMTSRIITATHKTQAWLTEIATSQRRFSRTHGE
jgi:hypothetical protein